MDRETFQENGLSWRRVANKEIASPMPGWALVTMRGHREGFLWGVLSGEGDEEDIVRMGDADTRAEARRLSVIAFGSLTENLPPELTAIGGDGDAEVYVRPWMKPAAVVALLVAMFAMSVAIALGASHALLP